MNNTFQKQVMELISKELTQDSAKHFKAFLDEQERLTKENEQLKSLNEKQRETINNLESVKNNLDHTIIQLDIDLSKKTVELKNYEAREDEIRKKEMELELSLMKKDVENSKLLADTIMKYTQSLFAHPDSMKIISTNINKTVPVSTHFRDSYGNMTACVTGHPETGVTHSTEREFTTKPVE